MKYLNFKLLFFLAALVLAIPPAWAETSTLNFTAACGGSGTADDGAEWTVTSDASESVFDNTSGIHYGTNKASVTYVQLSTSDVEGTITQVVVNARDAQASATVSVTVGGTEFTCTGSAIATNTSADYTFTGTGSGEIVVRIDRGTANTKAIYVKSVIVTYGSGGDTPQTVGTPTFSLEEGTYYAAQSVSITCATEGATIHYTTNGDTPDENSAVYSTPITVDETMTIKAIAVKSGMTNSEVAEATYTINDPSTLTQYRKITSTAQLTAGDYLIVCEDQSVAFDGSLTTLDAVGNIFAVVINDGVIQTNKEAYFTANKLEGNIYSLRSASGYSIGRESNKNGLDTGNSAVALQNNITFDDDGNAIIKGEAGPTLQYYKTTGQNRFRYFISDQQPVALYKKVSGEPVTPEISVTPSSVTITDVTGDDKTGAISATVTPAGTVNATASDGWSATSSSVTYQGLALHAVGTATFSSEGATDVAASLEYNYAGPLYILGTVNNGGWAPNNYVAMTRGADGLYTVRVTTNAGNEGMSWISFTKRVANDADDGAWNYIAPYRFVPYSVNGDAWWLTDVTVNQFNPLDFNTGHVDAQPVKMTPGTYDITINANDNTFKIEPYVVTVETPTFDPEAGSYKTFQSVTINCATDDATIHYTVDGSEPTESSPVYGEPIAVDSTMTIKAIAMMDGMANSAVAVAAYELPKTVATVAAANAVDANSYFLFTGDAVVTYAGQSTINSNYHYIFIRDKGAENGGGVIYYNTNNNVTVPNVQATNVLKRGWYAQLRPFNKWNEFQKAEFVEASGESATAAPFDRTGMELTVDNNVNEYIKIDDVTYNDGNITYAGQNREDVTYTYKVVNHFNVALEDGNHYNIEGVVTRYNNTIEFYPTAATLAKQAPELSFNPASVSVYEGVQDFPEPELTAPEGVIVQSYTSNNPAVVTVDNEGTVSIVGVGPAVITATTAENDYYLSGTATYDVEIKAKEAAGLSFDKPSVNATFGDQNVEEPTLTYPAGLTVTYSCVPDTVATVDPATGEVAIVGAGTATVTATTEGDESHNGGSVSYTLVVAKADATMSFAKPAINATYGGEAEANALTNDAGLTVTYSIEPEGVATIDAATGELTIVGTGTATVTATGEANANYNGTTATYTLTVAKANATMSFSPNSVTIVEGQAFTAPTLTNEANLAVTYESSNNNVATVDNKGNVTIVGVGETTITATGAPNDNYNGTYATYTITVEAKPVVAAPTFTPAAGYYNSVQNVTIACETADADIYYTTDGTVPSAESTKYIEAIPVGENMTIKAIAVKEGYTNSEVVEAEYVIDLPVQIAAPTFMPGSGHYTEAKEVAIACATPGALISYKIGNGEFQPYTGPFVVDHSCTVTAKVTMGNRTVWVENQASATYTINTLNPVQITDGYYQIMNNGSGQYANVQGRKTLTFTNAIDEQAGTVIRVQTENNGQVKVLRSQGADLQGYADRAMRYVPEVVQMVANKLHAEGTGELLGEDGLDAIMEKFNESFDYHLYVEGSLDNCRIYGKTPSMQPVVDFYLENQTKVDAKLPMLEGFINDAINKVLEKTNGRGSSILVPFSIQTIWERMGGNLIKPVDDASTMAFYRQVLTNKQYVWDFAYQTATFYLEKVKNHPKYEEYKDKMGELGNYIDKLEQIRPDTKYFIVQENGKVDYISEGNAEIINNAANTYWNVQPRETFTVNFSKANKLGLEYAITLYTDFAYAVPDTVVTAYKVTGINEQGVAVLEALTGNVPAQTPVLLKSLAAGPIALTLDTNDGTALTDNLLVGPDYLIKEYQIRTPQVESVFNLAKDLFGENFYNNYVAKYEHLMLKYAGTVNNKYFWGLTDDDIQKCTFTNDEGSVDCVIRTLSDGDQHLGFYNNWEAKTNQALLVTKDFDPVRLAIKGDVTRDGLVNISDVVALINIVMLSPEEPENFHVIYDYVAADFYQNGVIDVTDATSLIQYLIYMHVDTEVPGEPDGE